MKLFIDGHFLDGHKHGVSIYLDRLYSEYRQLKPEDELHFGLEPNTKIGYQLFSMPNVYVHQYRFGGVLRFLYDIPYLARKINADVVHTQYVAPLRIGYRAKRHVTLHDVLYEDFPDFFSPIYRWSRKLVFGRSARQAELITTVSEYSRSRIAALYGRQEADIHLTYNGVVVDDTQDIFIDSKIDRENNILYVSRFEKRKNHLALLNSLKELRKSNQSLRLVLVGFDVDGTLSKIREFVAQHRLEEAVEIKSHVSDEELSQLYRTAGVIAYPSYGEGFGMPIIEAFMLNHNTLFSNSTAMAEFTFAPDNTFNPSDNTEITAKIKTALSARNLIPSDWQAQRRKVIEKYNWRRSAQVLVGLYHGDATLQAPPLNAVTSS